ncbi:hypothetical protein [Nocardioides sp. Kera G14]|uniref:hypothetical protein n=1 Tax=Nocardioides sp. Kera G14 TaxID=2884264 RepID=UPI001D12D760|nr:hypothetical protein [Nocardioides sp. Kera G14]UDY22389.1 hypothetical protein LH076_09885 [Nocardioides sp. Kera G14]
MTTLPTFRHLHLSLDDGRAIAFSGDGDLQVKSEVLDDFTYRGVCNGILAMRFDVDGEDIDLVALDMPHTSDLTAISRAIRVLETLRAELVTLYGDNPPTGHCMTWGNWGRCEGRDDHPEGAHRFPEGPRQ